MPRRYDFPPSDQTAAFSDQGGCLSGFLIPPLAVIIIGFVLACIWLSSAPVTATLAAAPGQGDTSLAQSTLDPLSTPAADSPGQPGPISPIFRPAVQYWGAAIQAWATSAGVDPNLVATVMQIESCGDPRALSPAGAMGLFQVMPFHFTASDDPYNPDTNAIRGLAYLKRSLAAANGNVRLALAGYNGGISVIGRAESSWASETQHYASVGSGIYADAASGVAVSQKLEAWGGAGLCRAANARLGINP
jgi:soluble lytic murein transglycosylase-like protein